MTTDRPAPAPEQYRALALSTFAFTVCFAVWTLFSIIGVSIKEELGLSDTRFGLLVATPILTGSVSRLFLGLWTERLGGRVVFPAQMLLTAAAVWLLTLVQSYAVFLLAALGLGLAGGSFIVGVSYVARWFEKERQGTALGIFGAGNIGAALTSFVAPVLVLALGWEGTARVYAAVLALTGIGFLLLARTDPEHARRRANPEARPSLARQLAPLKDIRVWRFSFYYFFFFGAFVALASFLPRYYMGAHGVDLATAGTLAGLFALPGSAFRILGGVFSDRWGARNVIYLSFFVSLVALFVMGLPGGRLALQATGGVIEFAIRVPLGVFVALSVVLGFVMSLGSAAVFKHVSVYYPGHVGAVGGLVGMIGGLGGFVLPVAFGLLLDASGIWSTPFILLFFVVAGTAIWMHLAIRGFERIPAKPVPAAHRARADGGAGRSAPYGS